MYKSKKIFAIVLCVMCLFFSFSALAQQAEDVAPVATEQNAKTAVPVEVAEQAESTLPGYAQYVEDLNSGAEEEAEEVDEDAAKLDYAYSYIDGYADAIQADPDNKTNIKEAVAEVQKQDTPFYATFWSILPALIAIILALITKEVYSSLFVGIVAGGLLYANFNFETTLTHVVNDGFVASLSDSYNVGILLFLVLLGTLVAIMNKAGGSAAFGRWASKHIKTRVGAQLATILLGVLIFCRRLL